MLDGLPTDLALQGCQHSSAECATNTAAVERQDPEALTRVLHEKLIWLVAGAATMLALYVVVDVVGRRLRARAPTT